MATKESDIFGTHGFTERFPDAAEGHFRELREFRLSSVGLGTYLGNWDDGTDERYVEAIRRFLEMGGNVLDTASNYRFQRSERAIGRVLESLPGGIAREEVFVSSKAGYLPFDSEPPADVSAYFQREFVDKGIAGFEDLVGGSHCMTPKYIASQIDQSIANMGIEAIDLYYLHNPESQLAEIDRYTFEARIAGAFEEFERQRNEGKIGYYGVATWNGFRVKPDDKGYHSLERFVQIARQVGGDDHGFGFVQLPLNLAMPEAYLVPNQSANGRAVTTLQAASDLGVSVMASASILQGQLAANVPIYVRRSLGDQVTDALTSIQFVRSTPGIGCALIGMSTVAHVEENMSLTNIEPVSEEDFAELFTRDA